MVDGDCVRNIEGDYFLKITGDCHIEVGGGFFLGAEGAPKVVDKKGEKKNSKVQKHTIRFGSDVDVNTVGAKFELQGAEANIASTSTKVTGSMFENSASQQSRSAAEQIFSGDNSIEIVTPHLVEMINSPPSPIPKAMTGIRRFVGGSVETVMTPASSGADAIPRYTIANPLGPYTLNCGATGYTGTVNTGAFNVNVLAGFISMNAVKAVDIKAGLGMVLNAGLTVIVTGKAIYLN